MENSDNHIATADVILKTPLEHDSLANNYEILAMVKKYYGINPSVMRQRTVLCKIFAPYYCQLYFYTDLNKMVYCIETNPVKWIDAIGNNC